MKMETADGAQLVATLEALRQEVAALAGRVAALEAAAAGEKTPVAVLPPAPSPAPAPPPPAVEKAPEGLSEELVLVIAAAVAAFLGKKAHIRQIRLLGSAAWSQQGRVTIQASHKLEHR